MRIHDLNEAPIGDYHAVDIKDTGSFRHKTDRDIITSEKAQAKMRRVLAKVPQTIDLVFLDSGAPITDDELNSYLQATSGVFDYADLKHRVLTFPEPSGPNSIMLVITNNEGQQRVQLSPWMLMHRMGHGLAYDEGPENFEGYLTNVQYCIDDIAQMVRDGWGIPRLATIYAVATMKSAREKKLTSGLEVVFEWLAQYCVTGRVTLNRLTMEQMQKLVGHNAANTVDEDDLERMNDNIRFNEHNINATFARMMKALEGKVVVL